MSKLKKNILLFTVIGAAMMELIDTSIVNVASKGFQAIPVISRQRGSPDRRRRTAP
ncbi:MAG TPA: hypothetical protein VHD83_09400 [Puia sp.]|nr:hypothetical protein [Puia sp.]